MGLRGDTRILGRHILFVHPHNCGFELFVLVDAGQHVVYVFLKLLFYRVLFLYPLPQILVLSYEALHLHPEVSHDQLEVSHDSAEVLHLLAHLCCLFLQRARGLCIRLDVFLQFLYLVVKHKLKLLQLLRFLLQIVDSFVFVSNCSFPLAQLQLLTRDVLLQVVELRDQFVELRVFVLDVRTQLLLSVFLGFEFSLDFCKQGF